jgi:drug/metabolite transporter (DMT)-like permease
VLVNAYNFLTVAYYRFRESAPLFWEYRVTIALLYITVVLIWGSNWLVIKYQLGIVAPEVSVAYRIGISAAVMFAWSMLKGGKLRFSPREHLFLMLQGSLFFSTNFFLFYLAAAHITTGLIAVICSTASVMTMLLNSLLLKRIPSLRFITGAALGVLGIGLVFSPELAGFEFQSDTGIGLLLSLGGTFCFSLGSIVSNRNRNAGFSVCESTAWAMFYGVVLLFIFACLREKQFNFDLALPYISSLAYLSFVGTVVAFAAYFALLARINPEQAAYSTVLFPVVALGLSTFLEGYQWTVLAFLGVLLTLAGNLLVLRQPSGKGIKNLK